MKNQKGITLIALIITIIVMLILVAVAVTTAVNSGLFGHAGNATNEWSNQQEKEMDLDNQMTSGGETGLNNIVNHYTPNTTE